MKTVLEIAKECGAKPALKGPAINQCYFLDEAQLTATIEAWNRQNSEPIYQVKDFVWGDVTKDYYDQCKFADKRIVYLAPPQPPASQELMDYVDRLEKAINLHLDVHITPATSPKLCAIQTVMAEALQYKQAKG